MRILDCSLTFIPIRLRLPLKFGNQVLEEVTCARACVRVEGTAPGSDGPAGRATGWGETPLSAAWVWPSATLGYREREDALKGFCVLLAEEVRNLGDSGHPFEIGHRFIEDRLPGLQRRFNAGRPDAEALPHLAALVCFSLFDLAAYDAFGNLAGRPVFDLLGRDHLARDLGSILEPAPGSGVSFAGTRPADFLRPRSDRLPVWHLVGGLDPLDEGDLTGDEPEDGYPVLLRDWIRRDGLRCLKVKLRGNDDAWDHERLLRVGTIGREEGVEWLTADFNCTVDDPAYVNAILDRLERDAPAVHRAILYVEQPFPYDLESHRIDVRSVSARKPLYLDESAHDWTFVRLGRTLGWSGVALKTCKSLTGALLSLAWARAHGMGLMVQDLTNPMLAQIPHVLLAAHAGTIMGVESNGMQFYPEASRPEERVHPGVYRRRHGILDLSSIRGPGLGYRIAEIDRELPAPAVPFAD